MSKRFQHLTSWSLAGCCAAIITAAPANSGLAPPTSANVRQAATTTHSEVFDAASIKERQGGSTGRPRIQGGPASFNATNATVLDLIQYAFDIPEKHVVGDPPGWTKSKRFDVVARTNGAPLTHARLLAMVKTLLEDRFRLNASFERATMPVFALVTTGSDRAKEANLHPTRARCEVDPPLSSNTGQLVKKLNASATCGFVYGTDGTSLNLIIGSRVTMDQFVAHLSRFAGFDRPVVNQTGLSGEFDLILVPPDVPDASSVARLLTGLREQLGLVLRAEQGSVDVLRINRVEPPSPD